jgi:hypothetical protein
LQEIFSFYNLEDVFDRRNGGSWILPRVLELLFNLKRIINENLSRIHNQTPLTELVCDMPRRSLEDQRRHLRRNRLTRSPTQMIPLELRSAFAQQTRHLGELYAARALFVTRYFRSTMAILICKVNIRVGLRDTAMTDVAIIRIR